MFEFGALGAAPAIYVSYWPNAVIGNSPQHSSAEREADLQQTGSDLPRLTRSSPG